MITDTDRNVRTLIVSFVILIMALIPLRFYEYGESVYSVSVPASSVQVLGETVETVIPEVVLPVDEVAVGSGLEAPWNEIDGPSIR